MRTVEVYENERRLTVLRKYSADDLFPLDYSHYSDEYGTQRWSSLEEVPLPDGDGWRWASPFRVDYDGGNKNGSSVRFSEQGLPRRSLTASNTRENSMLSR